jgi:hypothetical protein
MLSFLLQRTVTCAIRLLNIFENLKGHNSATVIIGRYVRLHGIQL